MAKDQKRLKVFVASPGDLRLEREALEEVIKELNDTWSDTLGISLALVKWETHAFPGFGDDAQAVVNEEISDDYDIFIGMLWDRFGTPTKRAESGTEEEFERAYSRYCDDRSSVKLMFYFKEQPIPPSHIDIAQLSKVKDFQKRIRQLGGLDWSFENLEDFIKYLRIHLSRQVQEFSKRESVPKPLTDKAAAPAKTTPTELLPTGGKADAEEGFLDLIEEGTEQFELVFEVSQRMTKLMLEFSKSVESRSEELKSFDFSFSAGKGDIKRAKRIINLSAQDMDVFAERMEAEIPLFRESYSRAMEAFGGAASLLGDFRQENSREVEESVAAVKSLRDGLADNRRALAQLREIMGLLPRVTTHFNRAKRRCIGVLETFDKEMESGLKIASEVEALLKDLLSEEERGEGPEPESTC